MLRFRFSRPFRHADPPLRPSISSSSAGVIAMNMLAAHFSPLVTGMAQCTARGSSAPCSE
eukprot:7238331-Prymnesium_polylepis.1